MSKNLQSLSIKALSGYGVLPSLSRVSASRLIPVARATSVTLMGRPHSISFCFQNSNNVVFIAIFVFIKLYNVLTKLQNYDTLVSAKSFNVLTTKSALISLIFRGSKSPNQCSLNGLATANRLGLLLSRKIGGGGKRANAHHLLNTRKGNLSYVL